MMNHPEHRPNPSSPKDHWRIARRTLGHNEAWSMRFLPDVPFLCMGWDLIRPEGQPHLLLDVFSISGVSAPLNYPMWAWRAAGLSKGSLPCPAGGSVVIQLRNVSGVEMPCEVWLLGRSALNGKRDPLVTLS